MATVQRVINEPMDTEDILYYFPNAKIMEYKNALEALKIVPNMICCKWYNIIHWI